MGATGWIEPAAKPAAVTVGGREAQPRLNRIVAPASPVIIRIPIVIRRAAPLHDASGQNPISVLRDPWIDRRGITAKGKVISEQCSRGIDHDVSRGRRRVIDPVVSSVSEIVHARETWAGHIRKSAI